MTNLDKWVDDLHGDLFFRAIRQPEVPAVYLLGIIASGSESKGCCRFSVRRLRLRGCRFPPTPLLVRGEVIQSETHLSNTSRADNLRLQADEVCGVSQRRMDGSLFGILSRR